MSNWLIEETVPGANEYHQMPLLPGKAIEELVAESGEVVEKAISLFRPYATVLMFSGGNDSRVALEVCRQLSVELDAIIHCNTGTGIADVSQWCREFIPGHGYRYLEISAGSTYEERVHKWGFFGRGRRAHTFAYHVLKATWFRKIISQHFRQRKRGRPVLMLNGARSAESSNRKNNLTALYNRDPAAPQNIWTNIIHHWPNSAVREVVNGLPDCEKNPVSRILCRSGECLCGTMQEPALREEASFFYPGWGRWIDELETSVMKTHKWGWGDPVPAQVRVVVPEEQLALPFMPACQSCIA